MMRKTIAVAISVLGVVLGGLGSVPVGAVDAIPNTPSSHWPAATPLIISAYQRTADGNDLSLIEVFNKSDAPVDVAKWQLAVQYQAVANGATKSETLVSKIRLHEGETGKLAPLHHAVIELETGISVTNASYVSDGFTRPSWLSDTKTISTATQVGQLGEVSLVPNDTKIETDTYTLKTNSVKLNNATKTVYDDLWRRIPQSEPGYLASFYATTVNEGGLYNDKLYTPPSFPKSRIVEIYHHSDTCASKGESGWCGAGDYIKLQVSPDDELDKLVVRTNNSSVNRTTTNTFSLAERTVSASGYMTIMYNDADAPLDLTDAGGTIWLEEIYGSSPYDATIVTYDTFTDDNKNQAYIPEGSSSGEWTTTPQPDTSNLMTTPVLAVTVCPEGKYLNPDTGRCRTLEEAVNALAACSEGQERNPATNRCRAKVTTASSTLTPCGEGQERNPATNRCRSIASAVAELIPCNEGYERNPATNRCRKVAGVSTAAASNPKQLVESAKNTPLANWTWALVAVAATGAIGYGVYEWRHELLGFGRSVAAKFGKK